MSNLYSQSPVLLLYHHPRRQDAATIMDHVKSFKRYSEYPVVAINVANLFPKALKILKFSSIILHYSLFGSHPFALTKKFIEYCATSSAKKIFFFQDEHQYIEKRRTILKLIKADIIFTLLDDKYHKVIYENSSPTSLIYQTLTGYVSDNLVVESSPYFIPFDERPIDVGYRARDLPYYLGKGAREKSEIARLFTEKAAHTKLRLNISTKESDRIYGSDWYHFLGSCRFTLGVMAGTSIFDETDLAKTLTNKYLSLNPNATFSDVFDKVLKPFDGVINYRTISPRLFECAVLKSCMILFRDDYQGILQADIHYIPLEKDFSNIAEVFSKMADKEYVHTLLENAFTELVLSRKWSFSSFVSDFDTKLSALNPKRVPAFPGIVSYEKLVAQDKLCRRIYLNLLLFINRCRYKLYLPLNRMFRSKGCS